LVAPAACSPGAKSICVLRSIVLPIDLSRGIVFYLARVLSAR
jgi:hypothetical protein